MWLSDRVDEPMSKHMSEFVDEHGFASEFGQAYERDEFEQEEKDRECKGEFDHAHGFKSFLVWHFADIID